MADKTKVTVLFNDSTVGQMKGVAEKLGVANTQALEFAISTLDKLVAHVEKGGKVLLENPPANKVGGLPGKQLIFKLRK
jgi:hypothetical protein